MVTCFLDMDGVIADFVQGLCIKLGIENRYKLGLTHDYEVSKGLLIDKAEADYIFNEDEWANLPMMEDARWIVSYIEQVFGPENICILSRPGKYPGAFEGKMRWLKKYFPQFVDNAYIGKNKHHAAGPGKVLIDDHEKNVDPFRAHGGHAILLPRPWNKFHELSNHTLQVLQLNLAALGYS